MLTKELLSYILDIGEQMLVSGAEVNRVEDSISRICKAYDAKRVDVFTITSSIVVSIQLKSGNTLTQTRRVLKYSTDFDKLDRLNNLSYYVCKHTPDAEYLRNEIEKIGITRLYDSVVQYLVYGMIAGSFTIFYGGDLNDVAVSAAIGMILKLAITFIQRVDKNVFFVNILCSFVVGVLGFLLVRIGIGHSFDKIAIGNIMLLIPGLALTNSIRDIISGDTIAGLLRLSEAILVALSISFGFGLVSVFVGGMLK
ncbi:threonine/serine ThrE exporter family protein [Desulfosporosinus nitroreducens]|uniref:Threonine/serine exporter family protein n=1 Tax=Desulfosporosinus nitroreducens TaxID=2018668 RepID=A0ABT8QRC0_9FIRM|nr:threonine/serine exporter family protein [Desulfosporosinus nitroreducens]MDO0823903.1 threonine/serine exporter family protein [Desulfosporosinus nitroreducens]